MPQMKYHVVHTHIIETIKLCDLPAQHFRRIKWIIIEFRKWYHLRYAVIKFFEQREEILMCYIHTWRVETGCNLHTGDIGEWKLKSSVTHSHTHWCVFWAYLMNINKIKSEKNNGNRKSRMFNQNAHGLTRWSVVSYLFVN